MLEFAQGKLRKDRAKWQEKKWKTHDLGALMAEARKYDTEFTGFEDFADSLTDQFWAQHYSGGDTTGIGDDYHELRQMTQDLVEIIKQSISSKNC